MQDELIKQLLNKLDWLEIRTKSIELMLEVQARNAKAFHWIEGYGIGSTINEGIDGRCGVYVMLFGVGEHMDSTCCRVYKSHAKNLPVFIQNAVEWDDPDKYQASKTNPSKKELIKTKRYIEVPPFAILTMDGKETQAGVQNLLAGVVRWSREANKLNQEAMAKAAPAAQTQPPPTKPVAAPAKPAQASVPTRPSKEDVLTSWSNLAHAIEWSIKTVKVFEDEPGAKAAYTLIKNEEGKKAAAAGKQLTGPMMFSAWYDHVIAKVQ